MARTLRKLPKIVDKSLKISNFVENLDGTTNNIDVDKYVDKINQKVGKKVTGNLDNQNIDFDILVLLPKEFSSFDDDAIQLELRASDITGNNNITVHIYGTDGIEVGTGFDLTPSTANSWETKTITKSQLNAGTFITGQIFRINIYITIDSGDKIDISEGVVKFD